MIQWLLNHNIYEKIHENPLDFVLSILYNSFCKNRNHGNRAVIEVRRKLMEQKFEKKLKAFLPYIIIIGLVYLITPALLFVGSPFVSYLVLIGILPLTTAGCCAHYAMKKENDFWLCLVAPIFFIPVMFLYPIFRSGPLIALIYLVSYLLCGYLGLTVGDILSGNRGKSKKTASDGDAAPGKPAPRKPAARKPARKPEGRSEGRGVDPDMPIRTGRKSAARPERVDLDVTDDFFTEDPYTDDSLNTTTTSEDIDEILSEIQQRRSSD